MLIIWVLFSVATPVKAYLAGRGGDQSRVCHDAPFHAAADEAEDGKQSQTAATMTTTTTKLN